MALYQSGSGLGALVGVGTTNPTSNLQVYGTPIAAGNVFSVLNTAASGNVAQFSSSSGTALIINANGNVGIGKTNPGTLLDVNGAFTATSVACSSVTAQGTAAAGAIYMSGNQLEIGQGQTSDTNAYIDFHSAEGTYSDFTFRIIRNGGANQPVYWVNRGSGNSYFQNQDSGSFYFQSGGLDIGAITSTGVIYFGKIYTATTGTRPGTNYVLSYDCATPATPTASAVYYGQNVAFSGGTMTGRMWNNSGAPSFYAADTFLQGTNCYDGTNNGTGASSQFAGNLYLDGGLSSCLGGSGTTNQCYAGAIYFRTGLSGGGLTTVTPTIRMAIIPNTGYVGIGSNSPRCTLDVVGSGITEGIYAKRFYLSSPGDNTDSSGDNNTGGPWYGLGYSVDSGLTSYIQLASYYGLSFKTGGSYILMNGGNVGIGTTNPGYLIDGEVNANINGGAQIRNSSTGTSAITAWRLGNGNGTNRGGIALFGSGYTSASVYLQDGTYVYGTGAGGLTLNTEAAYPIYFATNNSERMRITSGGNVGIGITNPGAVLTVVGGSSTPVVQIHDSSSGGPDYGASYGMVNLTRGADTTKAHVAFIRAGNFVWQMGYISATNSLGLFPFNFSGTQGLPTMTWSGGNVGIGTATPVTRLDVWTGTARSGTAPPSYGAIYATADASGGTSYPPIAEFRHSNQSQGIGINFNSIFATGSGANQSILLYSRGYAEINIPGSGVGGNGYGNLLVDYPNAGSAGGCITIRNSGAGVGAFSSLIFEVDGSTSCTTSSNTPTAFTQGNGMLYCQNVGPSNASKMGFIQWNGGTEVETMTILPSGFVGIGRTDPSYKIDVYGAGGGVARFYVPDTSCYIYLDNGYAPAYQTAIQWMSGGSFKWINYLPANTTDLRWYNLGGDRMTLTYGGALTCSGDITAFSDIRHKINLTKIENALDKVSLINGYTFERVDTERGKRHAGVVAQEVLEVFPEVVNQNHDGIYSVAYGNLTALLIEAIKEERKKRESLETALSSLEERIKLLEQK